MPDTNLVIELTLVAVPLPPEREDAYWDAIRIVAEMICLRADQIVAHEKKDEWKWALSVTNST